MPRLLDRLSNFVTGYVGAGQGEPEEWVIWVCPVCGHYETESGDPFTTYDGVCPVVSVGGAEPHRGDPPKLVRRVVR